MARRRKTRAEARARYYIRSKADQRGWDVEHVDRGGDTVEENEIVAQFPEIGLGLNKPDFLMCLGGEPAVVVEAKNEADKLDQAIGEAVGYAEEINAAGRHRVVVAVGAAGTEDTGFDVAVRFRADATWVPLESLGYELTAFPSRAEVELAIAAGDGTTAVTVPEQSEFVGAAIEMSGILRRAKVEAPLRPKVIGAIVMAMYEGSIDIAPANVLASVNELAESAIERSRGMSARTKALLIETLRLTTADLDRLAPSIGRIVTILRRLNIRAVLQTDTDFLGMFYEAFLRYGYDNKALGIVFTPRHITRLCVDLVGVRATDQVIDVASGTGGFLVAAFDKMMAESPSSESMRKVKDSIYGFEINPTVWALSVLNMFFRGDGKSHMERGDCLTPTSRKSVRRDFTRAFLNPPFSQEDEPEVDFIDAALDALEPEGMLAAVVKAGIFADNRNRRWRERFLKRHTLVGVISLPDDLFYPTAAPTSIVIAKAHVPHAADELSFMARVWNDGFEKLKSKRVERPGSQLPQITAAFQAFRDGDPVDLDLAVLVDASRLADGAEWSPQEYLPQPHATEGELEAAQEAVLRSVFQAVGRFPDLSDEALEDFAEAWTELPDLPVAGSGPVSYYFAVRQGRSTGEKNYADGATAYVSSGDSSNSIVRLVAEAEEESFSGGVIAVTAFGSAVIQPWPFMARGNGGSAVRVLVPRFDMTVSELVWFAAQINLHRWRFFYARQAIKGRITRLVIEAPPERLADDDTSIAEKIESVRVLLDRVSRVDLQTA
jgi:type I restriction enzyme M protein